MFCFWGGLWEERNGMGGNGSVCWKVLEELWMELNRRCLFVGGGRGGGNTGDCWVMEKLRVCFEHICFFWFCLNNTNLIFENKFLYHFINVLYIL